MIRAFGKRHPRSIALVAFSLLTAIYVLPYVFLGAVDVTEGTGVLTFDALTGGVIWQIVLTVLILCMVWAVGWDDITGLRGPRDKAGMVSAYWIGAYPAIGAITFATALFSADHVSSPIAVIAVVLTLNLFVGMSEEIMFRGIIFGAIREKHTLFTAVCVSSIAFGFLHLVNLGMGQAFSLTAFQVLNATVLGVLFCALRLQTNSIWPPIFLHMIWNSYVMLGQAVVESSAEPLPNAAASTQLQPAALILPLLFLIVAVWVFYRYTRRTGHSLFRHVPKSTMVGTIRA